MHSTRGTKIAALAAGVFLAIPFVAGALSANDLQLQIQSLIARVAELTSQLNALGGQVSTGTSYYSPSSSYPASSQSHRICGVLARNLSQGSSGTDVSALQEFLRERGYFSARATGYYGPVTAQAVARWQAAEGVQAVGAFGPLSRSRLLAWCNLPNQGGGSSTERFSASPTSGSAPLAVTFSTWLSGFRPSSIYYTIDFGDGTSERAADCYAPADWCQSPGQNTHTYLSNGTYTATLSKITDPCAGQVACRAALHSEVVGRQVVTVGSSQACTEEYAPVCGQKQVWCITAPCNPIQQTYSNRCKLNADGATYLHDGACGSTTADPGADRMCKSWYDGCNTCSRSEPGGPAACTLRACIGGTEGAAYCTAYFSSGDNRAPVISSFAGPTTLAVNAVGEWRIDASDPENGPLQYSVTWGDEAQNAAFMQDAAASAAFAQTTTFTHRYAYAGTYTVRVIVRDQYGLSAEASATVRVEGAPVACTKEYVPVCGRQPGCMNTCPPGAYCTLQCQLYPAQTYSNRCEMNAAGASYLYDGQCQSIYY